MLAQWGLGISHVSEFSRSLFQEFEQSGSIEEDPFFHLATITSLPSYTYYLNNLLL